MKPSLVPEVMGSRGDVALMDSRRGVVRGSRIYGRREPSEVYAFSDRRDRGRCQRLLWHRGASV